MHDHQICPKVENAFTLLGKRWTGLIIHILITGPKRFSDIQKTIPSLSARVLTERFRELEENGIVQRNVYAETPVRIEYELTKKGLELKEAMDAIGKWAEKWN